MKDGFIKVAAAAPELRVADPKFNAEKIVECVEKAREEGIVGVFDSKYGDVVKTYSIGEFSKEMCGGPHVAHTGELGRFKIVKEQSSSAGVRRIKAILE